MADVTQFTWLPDELAAVAVEKGTGPVSPVSPATFIEDVASAMDSGEQRSGIKAARDAVLTEDGKRNWQGLIAFCLLHDIFVPDLSVKSREITSSDGRLSRLVLSVLGEDTICVLLLKTDDKDIPLGITDQSNLLLPARTLSDLSAYLEGRVPFFCDGRFESPKERLDPVMRRVLLTRLQAAGGGELPDGFRRELTEWEEDIVHEALDTGAERYEYAMKSLIGLPGENGFSKLTVQIKPAVACSGSALLSAMGVPDPVKETAQRTEWYWEDKLLARESPVTFLEVLKHDDVRQTLQELVLDEQILEKCVGTYREKLRNSLLKTVHNSQADGKIRERVLAWTDQLEKQTKEQLSTIELTYPWRSQSPALASLLSETLGAELGAAAAEPFADRLTLMQGADFQDPFMTRANLLTWEGGSYVVIPPISRKLAQWETKGQKWGYVPDSLFLEMDKSGRILVRFKIQGEHGTVQVSRWYSSMEQVTLLPSQVPFIAIWPSIPLETWKAYYVSVRGRARIEVFDESIWKNVQSDDIQDGTADACQVLSCTCFPYAVLVSRNDLSLGALLFHPDMYVPEESGETVAGMDIGDSGTAMAWLNQQGIQAVNMPDLSHVLLCGSRKDTSKESLPAFPLNSLVESAVTVESEGVDPFVSGRIVQGEYEAEKHPVCHFLWRTDTTGIRAQQILIAQLMLMMSFDMRMHGSTSVTWHIAAPQTMESEQRRHLQGLVQRIAQETEKRTGLLCKGAYASWHDLRCAGQYIYQSLGRTSFLMMDIGGADTNIALWLRGMPVPAAEISAGDGIAMAMHTVFMDIPLTAAQDLSRFPFVDAGLLANQLAHAHESVMDWEASRKTVDDLLGIHLEEMIQDLSYSMSYGYMNYTQSLLVLELAERCLICGLVLEATGNMPTMTDKLPSDLPLVLAGRGGKMYMLLPPELRSMFLRFCYLPLRTGHPTSHIMFQESPSPKMEAVYGLLMQETRDEVRSKIHELRGTVPLDWLLGHFLMLFHATFPQCASMLFPGACRADGMLDEGYASFIVQLAQSWQMESMLQGLEGCLSRLRVWPDTMDMGNPVSQMPPNGGDGQSGNG